MKKIILVLVAIMLLSACKNLKTKENLVKTVAGKKVVKMEIQNSENPKIMGAEDLFKNLIIEVNDNSVAQYVFGDSHAGYSDYYTNSYIKGDFYNSSGYLLMKGYASFADSKLNDRLGTDDKTYIYPYGAENIFANGVSEIAYLHEKDQVMTLQVKSEKIQKLALIPFINNSKDKIEISIEDDIVILEIKNVTEDYPKYFAISGDKDFNLLNLDMDAVAKTGLLEKDLKLCFETKEKEKEFAITIAINKDKDKVIEMIKKYREIDSISIHKQNVYNFLIKSYLWTDDLKFNSALMWSKLSSYVMFSDEYGAGIWAGLPWFRDNWGRDTFISMPGVLLVNGKFKESKALINNFAKYQNKGDINLIIEYTDKPAKDKAVKYMKSNFIFRISNVDGKLYNHLSQYFVNHIDELEQKIEEMNKLEGVKATYEINYTNEYGRVPNRVSDPSSIIYNTTDGTPWMIREIMDYLRYTGDKDYEKEIYPVVKLAIDQAIKIYVDEDAFLTHRDADTWMDAKFNENPWSARGNRANDIQALWYVTLQTGVYLANENGDKETALKWKKNAEKLRLSFNEMFWDEETKAMADRLREDDSKDMKLRPNQLMLLTTPFEEKFVDREKGAYIVKNSVNGLLYPYGIASLDPNHEYFHPIHTASNTYEKDSAYHNGTVWGWNAGFTVSAIADYGYQDFAYKLTENLSDQILDMGCRGSMSEVLDAFPDKDGNITLSGTYSQAWSVSEFNRNAYQDYLGFKPNMVENKIILSPAIPTKWTKFYSEQVFGKNQSLSFEYEKSEDEKIYNIGYVGEEDIFIDFEYFQGKDKKLVNLKMKQNDKIELKEKDGIIRINGEELPSKILKESKEDIIGELKFIEADFNKTYPTMENEIYIRKLILDGKYR